jgi:hypothetical protein
LRFRDTNRLLKDIADAVGQIAGFTVGNDFAVLNVDKRIAVRSRLDLAHELGHVLLRPSVSDGGLKRPDKFRLLKTKHFDSEPHYYCRNTRSWMIYSLRSPETLRR